MAFKLINPNYRTAKRRSLNRLGGFSPKSLSGLIVMLESDVGVTYTTTVSAWADQSGNGNNFTAPGGTQEPAYTASDVEFNNLPSMTFDGVNDILRSGALTFGPFTIIILAKQTGTAGKYMWYRNPAPPSNPSDTLYGSIGATMYTERSGVVSAKNLTVGWGPSGSPRVYAQIFDGTHASHKFYIDDVEQSMTSVISNNPGTGTTAQIMNLMGDNSATNATGKVGAFYIFNRSLSTAELTQMYTYITNKF